MTQKNTGAENTRWDLSIMYSGLEDPAIDGDIAHLVKMAKAFHAAHKGKLVETLGQAISDYTEITMLAGKISQYLSLLQSTDVADPKIKAKSAEVGQVMSHLFGEYLTFFELELIAMNEADLTGLYVSDKIVARHKPWIEHTRIYKPHILSEPVEAALTKRSDFGADAWSEFFNELSSDLRFSFDGEEKTLTEMLHTVSHSQDAEMREVKEYFNRSLPIFEARLAVLRSSARLSEREEKELRFMLEALISAKQMLDDDQY